MIYFQLGLIACVVLQAAWIVILRGRLRQQSQVTELVYFIRHQAAGVLHEFPFAEHPTGKQLLAVERALARVHVRAPGKEPWWVKVEEVHLLDSKALPLAAKPPPLPLKHGAAAEFAKFQVSATGAAQPPRR
jgi:hypothetical protein